MRNLIIAIIISTPFTILSQGIAEMPEANVLYRGYANKIQIGSNNGEEKLELQGTNCVIEKVDNGY